MKKTYGIVAAIAGGVLLLAGGAAAFFLGNKKDDAAQLEGDNTIEADYEEVNDVE